jgi:hydrogenase/urease accessory protein HupE
VLRQPLRGKTDHLAQNIGVGVFSASARKFIMSLVIG